MRTAIVVWADFFASELAVLNGKDSADRTHAHRFERAMLDAARAGHLRLRSMDAVGAPIDGKKIGAMSNDAITQHVAADTQDVRAWAREHWPELLQSRLLAEPNAAPAEQPASGADTRNAKPADDWKVRAREIAHAKYLTHTKVAGGIQGKLDDYAAHVEAEFRKLDIRGAHGLLTAGNIRREALQGEKWWNGGNPRL